jgi:acetyl esterase/lipase
MPAFELLSYPMIDDRLTTRSSQWHDAPVWDPASNEFAWRCYLGDLYGTDDVPGYAAPARVHDLHGLPPTFLSVGTADVVCDETIAFAQRLVHCGVSTDLRVHAGAPHGMDRRATRTRISRNSRREMLAWLAHQTKTSP